jgi:hypothetical protein
MICELTGIGARVWWVWYGWLPAVRVGERGSRARRGSWACEPQLSSDRRCLWCGSGETGNGQVHIVSWWCEVFVWIPTCLYFSVHGFINSELITCACSYLVLLK